MVLFSIANLSKIFFSFLMIICLGNFSYSQEKLPSSEEADDIYLKFLKNRRGNEEEKKIAFENAKEFIKFAKESGISEEHLSFVQNWIDIYEASQKLQSEYPNLNIDEWKQFKYCGFTFFAKHPFTFFAPKTLKMLQIQEDESCGGILEDESLLLKFDYGWNGSKISKQEDMIDFNEEKIEIDGKYGQFVTYQSSKTKKFFAKLYLELWSSSFSSQTNKNETDTQLSSLTMIFESKDKKEFSTAQQILKTVKFFR